jgi:hypothetical protein
MKCNTLDGTTQRTWARWGIILQRVGKQEHEYVDLISVFSGGLV